MDKNYLYYGFPALQDNGRVGFMPSSTYVSSPKPPLARAAAPRRESEEERLYREYEREYSKRLREDRIKRERSRDSAAAAGTLPQGSLIGTEYDPLSRFLLDGRRMASPEQFAKQRAGVKDITMGSNLWFPEEKELREAGILQNIGAGLGEMTYGITEPLRKNLGLETSESPFKRAEQITAASETEGRKRELKARLESGGDLSDEEAQWLADNDKGFIAEFAEGVKSIPGLLETLADDPEARREFLNDMVAQLPASMAVSGGMGTALGAMRNANNARKLAKIANSKAAKAAGGLALDQIGDAATEGLIEHGQGGEINLGRNLGEGFALDGALQTGIRVGAKGISKALGGENAAAETNADVADTQPMQEPEGEPRFQFIGEQGAANLNQKQNFDVAQEMEKSGKDEKAIKLATGWEKGADGKWRHEVPDIDINIDRLKYNAMGYKDPYDFYGKKQNLSDVVTDSELFVAYPQLKDVKVEVVQSGLLGQGTYAMWNDKKNLISISSTIYNYKDMGNTAKEWLSHEIQHAIQDLEGFSSGTSIKRGNYDKYRRTAGEVEARNVERRLNMTPEERRNSLASETEDVARDKQIYTDGGGTSYSIEPANTDTPAFKKWFGDSKVVDENGKPMVVYHGTNNDFTEFKNKGRYNGIDHKGFFFGDKETASNFGVADGMPVYLSIDNPYIVDVEAEIRELESLDELDEGLKSKWRGETVDDFETGRSAVAYFDDNINYIYERAEENGNNGIIVYGADGSINIVAFEPTQIKSATDNIGTFDGANPDIRYHLGEYTQPELDNWANSKRIKIYENNKQLMDFIESARQNNTSNNKMYFGKIPENLAERIKNETGIDVDGYNVSISENEIRKIFKTHGSEATEAPRGQRAITKEDIASIPQIIQNPDKIALDNEPYGGKPVIKFVKTINGRTTVVSYVSDKHGDLAVQTMYSGRGNGTLATPTDAFTPETTSETPSGTNSVSTDNIQNPPAPIPEKHFKSLLTKLGKTALAKEVITDPAKMLEYLKQHGQSISKPMQTPRGEVYGFATTDGRIFLDPAKMNANTPVHEYGHLWTDFVKRGNESLYHRLSEAARQSDYYKSLAGNPNYSHLSERGRAEEAIAHAIGSKGEGMYRSGASQGKLRQLLNELWEWLANKLGLKENIRNLTPEQLQSMSLGELAEGAARDLLGGRRIFGNPSWAPPMREPAASLINMPLTVPEF